MVIGFKQCKTLEPHYSPILTKLVIHTVGDKKGIQLYSTKLINALDQSNQKICIIYIKTTIFL